MNRIIIYHTFCQHEENVAATTTTMGEFRLNFQESKTVFLATFGSKVLWGYIPSISPSPLPVNILSTPYFLIKRKLKPSGMKTDTFWFFPPLHTCKLICIRIHYYTFTSHIWQHLYSYSWYLSIYALDLRSYNFLRDTWVHCCFQLPNNQ